VLAFMLHTSSIEAWRAARYHHYRRHDTLTLWRHYP
jgi:hypothetical protein